MSFLPFVLSFLLILVLASAALFNSFRSTTLEKKIILAQSRARLSLINLQEKKKIDKLRKGAKKGDPPKSQIVKQIKIKSYGDPRHQRSRYESSKFNLSVLWSKSDPTLFQIVYESAIRLLEILYQNADFYREERDPSLARTLLNALIEKKGKTFLELFPDDPHLAKIYYKMLKGTNTGYPPLEEHFTFVQNGNQPPVRFRYATAPLLEAILGKQTVMLIMNEEKIGASKPGSKGILTEQQLSDLLQKHPSPLLSPNALATVFSFNNQEKGDPHAFCDPETHVIAER